MASKGLHDKYSNYHYCIVRECKNTSIKNPEKLWIKVPSDENMRNTWLQLAKRDPVTLSSGIAMYFCEDHFNLESDMENYMQYKIMGSVKRIRMKPNCVPTRFDCQMERKRKQTLVTNDEDVSKKRVYPIEQSSLSISSELLKDDAVQSCSSVEDKICDKILQAEQCNPQFRDKAVQAKPEHQHVSCQVVPNYDHKVTQVSIMKHYRSKKVQFSATLKDAISSPIKSTSHQSTSTSPNRPSLSGCKLSTRRLVFSSEEKYDSDVSYTPSLAGSSFDSSPSKPSSQSTVDCYLQGNIRKDEQVNLQCTLSMIRQKPRLYIGVPKNLFFLIEIISNKTNILENHILLCLMKIRTNRTFSELADAFDISLPQASKICEKEIVQHHPLTVTDENYEPSSSRNRSVSPDRITRRKYNLPVRNSFHSLSYEDTPEGSTQNSTILNRSCPDITKSGRSSTPDMSVHSLPNLDSQVKNIVVEELKAQIKNLKEQLLGADCEIQKLLGENYQLQDTLSETRKKCDFYKSLLEGYVPGTPTRSPMLVTKKKGMRQSNSKVLLPESVSKQATPKNTTKQPATSKSSSSPAGCHQLDSKRTSSESQDAAIPNPSKKDKLLILSSNNKNRVVKNISDNEYFKNFSYCHHITPRAGTIDLIKDLPQKLNSMTKRDFCIIMIGEDDFHSSVDLNVLVKQ